MVVPGASSHRSLWNRLAGVPAGMLASLTLMLVLVVNVKADAALALTCGDGALSVSALQGGLPDRTGPPAFTRCN